VEAAQKERLAALLARSPGRQFLSRQGEQWPTATMQGVRGDAGLRFVVYIMNDATEKFQNLLSIRTLRSFLDARGKGQSRDIRESRGALIQESPARSSATAPPGSG